MNTRTRERRDGMIGLGMLGLMTIALIASETGSGLSVSESSAIGPLPTEPAPVLIDLGTMPRPSSIGGAVRELRVLPMTIESRVDLHWTSDEDVIEEYRRSAF